MEQMPSKSGETSNLMCRNSDVWEFEFDRKRKKNV
jgi:hypothetical protein